MITCDFHSFKYRLPQCLRQQYISIRNRAFSRDVTTVILLFQNNETAVMFVPEAVLWDLDSFCKHFLLFQQICTCAGPRE